jgi:hypothetical protein
MSELDQLRQEAEQLKNQIRVSRIRLYCLTAKWKTWKLKRMYPFLDTPQVSTLHFLFSFQDARKACADATLSQVTK